MPTVLLKPFALGYKNRLFHAGKRRSFFSRDVITFIAFAFIMYGLYSGTSSFLERTVADQALASIIPARLLSVSLFAFFLLLLFSNSIAALGFFYAARDLPLLLTLPISSARLYLARIMESILSSSWMFIIFAIPTVLAYYSAFDLSWTFLLMASLLVIPFLVIPAALGGILVTLFVNICPANRIRELLLGVGVVMVATLLAIGHKAGSHLVLREQEVKQMLLDLSAFEDPLPWWIPSKWISAILTSYLPVSIQGPGDPLLLSLGLIISSAIGLLALGFLVHDIFFARGWNIAAHGKERLKVRGSSFTALVGRALIPFNPQLRGLCYKEIRMFMRDTTQSLQLLLLLMLTFIYLYNFRALRVISTFEGEAQAWWEVILSVANMAFGACVVAAIATRFVFPSISLEGNAYALLRTTPLSIHEFLKNKFWIWLVPMSVVSLVLLVSGTLAIQASVHTVVCTALLAVVLSAGIVGLGIGLGAVYARFDWDSPSQVTASFGSLVYMLLAMVVTMLTLIPAAMVFMITSVPNFAVMMNRNDYLMALTCAFMLIFFINTYAARKALSAGEQHLKDLERD